MTVYPTTNSQGRPIMFDQLATLDPAMHANLLAVKRHEGDPADLCLDFTAERDTLGVRRVEELVPGGAQVSVSASNVLLYVHLMAAHVQGRVAVPIEAFVSGLKTVCGGGGRMCFLCVLYSNAPMRRAVR